MSGTGTPIARPALFGEASVQAPGPRLRVLILEDRASDVELMFHALRREGLGVEVLHAEDGERFRELLLQGPDVILADYRVPGMDAHDAIEYVQRLGLDIPVIVVSGSINEDEAVTCLKRGASDYLLKDRLGRLASSIAHALDEKALRDEQRRQQAALRASEERFSKAFHASPVAMAISRVSDGRYVDANQAFLRLFGCQREDVLGRSATELQFRLPPILEGVHAAQGGHDGAPAWEEETTIRARSGGLRHVLVSYELIDVAGDQCVLRLMQDITERKAAEEERIRLAQEQAARAAAEAAQQQAAFLAHMSTELSSSLDFEATVAAAVRLVVPRLADWCAVHLFDSGDLGNSPLPLRVAVARRQGVPAGAVRDGSASDEPGSALLEVLQTRQPLLIEDVSRPTLMDITQDRQYARQLSRTGAASAMIVPLLARGNILGAMTFVAAESGRRYGANDLVFATQAAHAAALAIDNARLYELAQKSLREVDEVQRHKDALLQVIAHDLRTPLTAIRGWAQMGRRQQERAGVPADSTLMVGLRTIDQSALRAAAIIDDLHDLAQLQSGHKLALRLTPFDVAELLREVIHECEGRLGRRVLKHSGLRRRALGTWDRGRLTRVFQNLLDNAVKYSPDGSRIDLRCARVDEAGKSWVVVSVRDRGIGIPAHEVAKVFNQSYRASNVPGSTRGTGVGLASARQIVELHGGAIRVRTRLNAGSTFTVRLPMGDAQP